jgi:hypothetical protein
MSLIKARSLPQRVFDVEGLCPQCGQDSVIGYLLLNERGVHMHTRYLCTFWPSSSKEAYFHEVDVRPRCGWSGWTRPRIDISDGA